MIEDTIGVLEIVGMLSGESWLCNRIASRTALFALGVLFLESVLSLAYFSHKLIGFSIRGACEA